VYELALINYSAASHHRLISLALAGIASPHTRRAYGAALDEFLTWSTGQVDCRFTKQTVQLYRSMLVAKGMAPASINQRLAAVRRLAQEAADDGLLDPMIAVAISKVHGVRMRGVRLGRWLDKASLQQLSAVPSGNCLKVKRDRSVLALLIGGGLRRGEVADVAVEQIRLVEGRWAIVDLIGKHGRIRTVPIPKWVKVAIDEWTAAAQITTGKLFRRIRLGKIVGESLSPQAIYDVVTASVDAIGTEVSPHDLRRSFARLAHENHAPLEQLSITLGHASVTTTEKYVGAKQDFRTAPCDVLGLDPTEPSAVAADNTVEKDNLSSVPSEPDNPPVRTPEQ
jgi:integrase